MGPLYRMSRESLFALYLTWLMNHQYVETHPEVESSLKEVISRLFEGGIMKQIQNSYYYPSELAQIKKVAIESEELKPLTFNHIRQMMLLAAIGWVLSVLAFCYEKCKATLNSM